MEDNRSRNRHLENIEAKRRSGSPQRGTRKIGNDSSHGNGLGFVKRGFEYKWNIHITTDIKNSAANTYVKNVKKYSLKGKNYIIYEILMKNKSNQFSAPIFLYTSLDPFQIEGWTIYDNKNKKIIVKITKILNTNKDYINSNIFSLSETERLSGKVWYGPFNKKQIIRIPKHRN